MNEHLNPQSISQRADHLEEEMMHELERVVTKSTLHYLSDGEVKMDSSADLWKSIRAPCSTWAPTRACRRCPRSRR